MGNDNGEYELPDNMEWWWADMSAWQGVDYSEPRPMLSYLEDGKKSFPSAIKDRAIEDQVRWLAPIPGPAVCAALARYSEALDDLDALWDGADFITRNNVTNRFNDADDALHDTIRAERDGAA